MEIQRGARVGSRCKVQSHTFICEGVTIGDEVFVGHGVVFVNDKRPRATNSAGRLQTEADWQLARTSVENGASIGSGAVILGGLRIGAGAMIGAGALVAQDVAAGATVAGIRHGCYTGPPAMARRDRLVSSPAAQGSGRL